MWEDRKIKTGLRSQIFIGRGASGLESLCVPRTSVLEKGGSGKRQAPPELIRNRTLRQDINVLFEHRSRASSCVCFLAGVVGSFPLYKYP